MDNLIPLPTIGEFLLQDFMIPMHLEPQDLSEATKIPLSDIFAILNNVIDITPEISNKLASFFGVSPLLFYNIQQDLKQRAHIHLQELQYA